MKSRSKDITLTKTPSVARRDSVRIANGGGYLGALSKLEAEDSTKYDTFGSTFFFHIVHNASNVTFSKITRNDGRAIVNSRKLLFSQYPNWYQNLTRALNAMSKLKENWNSYGAPPPSGNAIENARVALELLVKDSRIIPVRIDPSVEGGICIVFQKSEKYADIEFSNHGGVCVGFTNQSDIYKAWESSIDETELGHSLERILDFFGS